MLTEVLNQKLNIGWSVVRSLARHCDLVLRFIAEQHFKTTTAMT